MAVLNVDTMGDPRLAKLESLTRETFTLWNEIRVGFSWRSYYMDHTLRVRANALAIGGEEGADPRIIAYAATLHDITKRYDGPFKMDSMGNRIVNEDGLWVNEPLQPARSNLVTKLYHEMNLYYQVHHDSGARIAERLLAMEGFDQSFADQVSHVIRGHLRPINPPWQLGGPDDPFRDPESCVLYDADTIDANLGAVAFYRHVQIHGYRVIKEKGALNLYDYVDAVGQWADRKRDFIDMCITKTGKDVAADRFQVDKTIHQWLENERQSDATFQVAKQYGLLGLVDFFLRRVDDPNMHEDVEIVEREWLPARRKEIEAGEAPAGAEDCLQHVEQFLHLLRAEMDGRIGGVS